MTSLPVSIIIPCYNAVHYVADAIRSALEQSYPNKEIIVIDDGSTDGSLDVIRSFAACIRWETGPNRGGSAARNRGLKLAQGEFIQFLDADDILFPDKLAEQVPIAVRLPGTMVFCDWEVVSLRDGTARTVRPDYGNGQEDPVCFCLQADHLLQTSAPLHFRSSLEKVGGFREELPCSQERDLHLRMACAGIAFHHMPRILFRVRRVKGSVSGDDLLVLNRHEDVFLNAARILQEEGSLTIRRKEAFARAFSSDACDLAKHGRGVEAGHYFALAGEFGWLAGLKTFNPWVRPLAAFAPVLAARAVAWKRRQLS